MEIYNFFGKVIVYGGGTVALAYILFMFLGQRWIEAKFAERLEAYKNAQERELTQYRHQISIMLSRVLKIHEKEIEVLPEIWHKLQIALGYVAKITSPLQFSPDFSSMDNEALEEFLNKSNLTESHKKILLNTQTKERNTTYTKIIFWYDLRDAKSAVSEFHNFFIFNRIFLSQDLKKEFQEIDKLLSSALTKREIGEQAKGFGGSWELISEAYKGLDKKAEKIVARIEKLVQERLEFSSAKPDVDNMN